MNMRYLKSGLSLALAASMVGCASVPDKRPPAPAVDVETVAVSSNNLQEPIPDSEQISPSIDTNPASMEVPVERAAAPHTASSAGPDVLAKAAYSEPVDVSAAAPDKSADLHDPWERFNRRMHRINSAVDRSVARPVAKAYVKVVPEPVRATVSNFFDNLGQPATAVNALLQGKVKHSIQALGRFVVNSTVGVAGLFDPAKHMKLPAREEDFGQTLAVWGWKRSRYLELPFFGPSTVRDAFGIVGDSPLQPTSYVEADKIRVGLTALNLVDVRTRLLAFDAMRDEIGDDYLLVRDTWSQRRDFQIRSDSQDDSSLPTYLTE